MILRFAALPLIALLALAGCDQVGPTVVTKNPKIDPEVDVQQNGSIFGGGGLNIFGGGKPPVEQGGGIGVNSFLWRATLDTLSFMPLASADPFGGVIITDWYSPPETPNERFKINIFILDRQLRADGVRAAVFRQTRSAGGGWVDETVDPTTQTNLENAILVRARQLRVSTASAQ
ncbi:MAG TPA: DUF3576 domain-containing protein [Stellaceae bacterium]|nr:DUF3576 domain-containing protein [Stellaceae bacterium]